MNASNQKLPIGLLRLVIDLIGRGGGIRTRDPLRPRQVRYQAALRPDRHSYCTTLYFFVLLAFAGSSRRYAAAAR